MLFKNSVIRVIPYFSTNTFCLKRNSSKVLENVKIFVVSTKTDEIFRNDDLQPPHQPEIPFSLQTKYEQTR